MTHCGAEPLAAARELRAAHSLGQALQCYDLALTVTMRDTSIYYEAAATAYEAGDSIRLMQTLRAAVRVAPKFGDGHFELGNALAAAGRPTEAIDSFRAAIKCKDLGDRPMAFNNLGNVLSDVGDAAGAMKEYRKGLRFAPTFT